MYFLCVVMSFCVALSHAYTFCVHAHLHWGILVRALTEHDIPAKSLGLPRRLPDFNCFFPLYGRHENLPEIEISLRDLAAST